MADLEGVQGSLEPPSGTKLFHFYWEFKEILSEIRLTNPPFLHLNPLLKILGPPLKYFIVKALKGKFVNTVVSYSLCLLISTFKNVSILVLRVKSKIICSFVHIPFIKKQTYGLKLYCHFKYCRETNSVFAIINFCDVIR